MDPASPLMERVLYEVKKTVVGQDHFLERVLVAMLAGGHLLVEGVPGLAKTLTVKTLAATVHGSFRRIQFTPDLVPADLVGTRIYNQRSGDFSTSLGPVFCNLLLADEINRAPAKVQSALLEVMQEHQVTIAGDTHKVPDPFLVMATQNPIETEGTYARARALDEVDRGPRARAVQEVFVRRASRRRDAHAGQIPPVRREPAGLDPPHRVRARARLPARARLRAARGRGGPRARRAAPPARALL